MNYIYGSHIIRDKVAKWLHTLQLVIMEGKKTAGKKL